MSQLHEGRRDAAIGQFLGQRRQVFEIAGLHEWVEVAVQAADQADSDFAGLCLGVHAIVERARILRDVLSFDRCVLEDDVLHFGLLGDRFELVREEDQAATGRRGRGLLLCQRLSGRLLRGRCTRRHKQCRNQEDA